MKIHEILLKDKNLANHVPDTLIANRENIKKMLSIKNSIIIKPVSRSLGIGVMMIESNGHKYVLSYMNRKNKKIIRIPFSNEFPEVLTKAINEPCLVQERIPLATFKGCPYDLRVSVQKNRLGEWEVTGIAGKVAKKNSYVTNVASGGSVYTLNELLNANLDIKAVRKKINLLSIEIAKHLEQNITNLADIGLDIGITDKGEPMFIECNGRDLRMSFKYAKMYDTWKAAHANPIGYSRFLLDQII